MLSYPICSGLGTSSCIIQGSHLDLSRVWEESKKWSPNKRIQFSFSAIRQWLVNCYLFEWMCDSLKCRNNEREAHPFGSDTLLWSGRAEDWSPARDHLALDQVLQQVWPPNFAVDQVLQWTKKDKCKKSCRYKYCYSIWESTYFEEKVWIQW